MKHTQDVKNTLKHDLLDILICTSCREGDLERKGETKLICKACGYEYKIHEGIPVLLTKESIKNIDHFYSQKKPYVTHRESQKNWKEKLLKLIEPPSRIRKGDNRALKLAEAWNRASKISTHPTPLVLTIGNLRMPIFSDSQKDVYDVYNKNSIKMDITFKRGVDLVADGYTIPFPDKYFDLVVAQASPKHLVNPHNFITEVKRILKPGGIFYAEFAYLLAFHRWPGDYFRFTPLGISELLTGFDIVDMGANRGASYTIAEILILYCACLLSFNNHFLYSFFKIFFGWILHPVRYLDIFLANNRWVDQICQTNYCTARRREIKID